jgi:hypothetical protein
MRKRLRDPPHLFLRALALTLAALACERAGPRGDAGPQPILSDIQAQIFDNQCALSGCHLGAAAPLGLDLAAGRAGANLVNVASAEVPGLLRVDPGNPDDSYLIIKLEGDPRIAPGTERMPLGRPPLEPEQIRAIRQWIADGAPLGDESRGDGRRDGGT